MGFVNCDWALKGTLKASCGNSSSKISAESTTFDGKLYTFKEMDYKNSFDMLNIYVKKND